MSRSFPLATVLRVRGIQEELCRGRLAAAAADRAAAAQAADTARLAYLGVPVEPAATVQQFLTGRSRRDALALGAQRAVGDRAAAGDRFDGERVEWSAAAMRLSALERLAERSREATRLADLAADQRTAEETAAAVLAARAAR